MLSMATAAYGLFWHGGSRAMDTHVQCLVVDDGRTNHPVKIGSWGKPQASSPGAVIVAESGQSTVSTLPAGGRGATRLSSAVCSGRPHKRHY